jgi:hypothetical protein
MNDYLFTNNQPRSHRALDIEMHARDQQKQLALLNGLYMAEASEAASKKPGTVAKILRSLTMGIFA